MSQCGNNASIKIFQIALTRSFKENEPLTMIASLRTDIKWLLGSISS